MKNILELLQLLLEYSYKINTESLCSLANQLFYNKTIREIEFLKLMHYFNLNVPLTKMVKRKIEDLNEESKRNGFSLIYTKKDIGHYSFWWDKHDWTPRRKWLRRQIVKLKKEKVS